MIMIYKKTEAHQLTDNLNTRELDCKCDEHHCTRTLVHIDIPAMFEDLRRILDVPLTVTSGFRCSFHNYDVGGVCTSRHTAGMAIDIKKPEDVPFDKFYRACNSVFPFVLPYKHKDFCHCDVDRR